MARTVNEVMTHDPRTVEATATIAEAARHMREGDVGNVIVMDGGSIAGIVTDRDITIRATADGKDPNSTSVREVCSGELHTITPDEDAQRAARFMREHDVRRLPVVQDDRPVGVVSIGDLAVALDDESALADISAADPNR